jgi:hypothetical protein
MFAKVANRLIRRRSPGQESPTLPEQQPQQVVQVDIAPDLLRWSDFSTPFPSVSMGGYSRFYETYTISEPTDSQSPPLSPFLSQPPSPSLSSEKPSQFHLFETPRPSCLPIIREVSLESLTPKKSRNLTITTLPHSLKRRQKRLFRTPSIERDFGFHSPLDTSFTVKVNANMSPTSITAEVEANASPTDIHSTSSSDSHQRSDSSEFPLTPSTSFEDENVNVMFSSELLDELSLAAPHYESESGSVMATSPTSPQSYCTVKVPHHRHYEPVESRPISLVSEHCGARSDFSE